MSLEVSTVGARKSETASQVVLQFALLDINEKIEPTDAYTLADLRIRAPKSGDAYLCQWTRLRGVSLVNGEGEIVCLPFVCDAPNANWVKEHGQRSPGVMRSEKSPVNYKTVGPKSTEEILNRLWFSISLIPCGSLSFALSTIDFRLLKPRSNSLLEPESVAVIKCTVECISSTGIKREQTNRGKHKCVQHSPFQGAGQVRTLTRRSKTQNSQVSTTYLWYELNDDEC